MSPIFSLSQKKQRRLMINLVLVLTVLLLASLGLVQITPDGELQLPQPTPSPNTQQIPEVDASSDQLETVVVARVIDGDTIELEDGRTLRYIGIDTPETKHPTIGRECFGEEASQRNRELVLGQTVQIERDVSETDRYQRILRYVWLDGVLINQQLVAEGFATAASFPPDVKRQPELRAAEQAAREAGSGLWSACQLPTTDASPTPSPVSAATDV